MKKELAGYLRVPGNWMLEISLGKHPTYTNLDTSCGRLTNHHSRTLHMMFPKI